MPPRGDISSLVLQRLQRLHSEATEAAPRGWKAAHNKDCLILKTRGVDPLTDNFPKGKGTPLVGSLYLSTSSLLRGEAALFLLGRIEKLPTACVGTLDWSQRKTLPVRGGLVSREWIRLRGRGGRGWAWPRLRRICSSSRQPIASFRRRG